MPREGLPVAALAWPPWGAPGELACCWSRAPQGPPLSHPEGPLRGREGACPQGPAALRPAGPCPPSWLGLYELCSVSQTWPGSGVCSWGPGGQPQRPQWALSGRCPSCLPCPLAGAHGAVTLALALPVGLTGQLGGPSHAAEFIGTWWRRLTRRRLTNVLTQGTGLYGPQALLGQTGRETGENWGR